MEREDVGKVGLDFIPFFLFQNAQVKGGIGFFFHIPTVFLEQKFLSVTILDHNNVDKIFGFSFGENTNSNRCIEYFPSLLQYT